MKAAILGALLLAGCSSAQFCLGTCDVRHGIARQCQGDLVTVDP